MSISDKQPGYMQTQLLTHLHRLMYMCVQDIDIWLVERSRCDSRSTIWFSPRIAHFELHKKALTVWPARRRGRSRGTGGELKAVSGCLDLRAAVQQCPTTVGVGVGVGDRCMAIKRCDRQSQPQHPLHFVTMQKQQGIHTHTHTPARAGDCHSSDFLLMKVSARQTHPNQRTLLNRAPEPTNVLFEFDLIVTGSWKCFSFGPINYDQADFKRTFCLHRA